MFTPTTHPYVGTTRIYVPQGFAPYSQPVKMDPATILPVGDSVTVESAWTRPYLDATAPALLYVRSSHTGKRTHVTADDLRLPTF